jgi:hypothetical protein
MQGFQILVTAKTAASSPVKEVRSGEERFSGFEAERAQPHFT